MTRHPIFRESVREHYWRFAFERHSIYERRAAGLSAPWTSDPILRQFKFCNVFRAADRECQFLLREIIYPPKAATGVDLAFQIVAFRLFSRGQTWKEVSSILGHAPEIADLGSGRFESALTEIKSGGRKLYTNAFILCASNAYDKPSKHQNHVELLRHIFVRSNGGTRLLRAQSLRELYEILHEFPLLGDFMSYQIAIDLNYSELFAFSENDFVQPGPGALRGIRKVFVDTVDLSLEEIVQYMVRNQDAEFKRLGLDFRGLRGRRLHAIDCQGLFCEVDKYCREALPELLSARVRIKSRFSPTSGKVHDFFPPKWGLNSQRDATDLALKAPEMALPGRNRST